MKETKKFDNWIGFLSISVVVVIVCVFTLTISNTHLAKGTYGANQYSCFCNAQGNNCGWYENGPGLPYTIRDDTYCDGIPKPTGSSSTTPTNPCTDGKVLYSGGCYDVGQRCNTSSGAIGIITADGHCINMPTVAPTTTPSTSSGSSSGTGSTTSPKTVPQTGCYACDSGFRYFTKGATFPTSDSCNTAAPVSGYSQDGNSGYCSKTVVPSTGSVTGSTHAPAGVVYVYFKNAEGTETKKTCTTDTNGKLDSNCISSVISICSGWSTTYCPNHVCGSNNTQILAYDRNGLVNATFKTATNLYCKAGTSGGSGGNVTPTVKPTNPTEKPASTSTGTVKPATTTKPTNTNNNPQTGTVGIIVAWLVGLSAIVYSLWYFKKSSSIN